jgi:hypothetical protein
MNDFSSLRPVKLFHVHHHDAVWSVQRFAYSNKDICICHHGCKKFKPGQEDHCPHAAAAFEASKEIGVVLVHSCNLFEKQEENDE